MWIFHRARLLQRCGWGMRSKEEKTKGAIAPFNPPQININLKSHTGLNMLFPDKNTLKTSTELLEKIRSIRDLSPTSELNQAYLILRDIEKFIGNLQEEPILIEIPEEFNLAIEKKFLEISNFIDRRIAASSSNLSVRSNIDGEILDRIRQISSVLDNKKPIITLQVELGRADSAISDLKEKHSEHAGAMQEEIASLNEKISGLLATSNQKALSIFDEEFKALQNQHRKSARCWMVSTFFSLLIAILCVMLLSSNKGFPLLVPDKLSENPDVIWVYLASKFFVYAICLYTIVFCSKNYSKSKHNEIVFGHRSASVNAVALIYNALQDDSAKNTVIQEASKSIFGHINTGYIPHNSDQEDSYSAAPLQQLIQLSKESPLK